MKYSTTQTFLPQTKNHKLHCPQEPNSTSMHSAPNMDHPVHVITSGVHDPLHYPHILDLDHTTRFENLCS